MCAHALAPPPSLAHLSISLSSARVVLEICLLASVSPRASGEESGVTRFSVSASVSQLVNTTTLLVWKVPPPMTCARARETLFCSPCLPLAPAPSSPPALVPVPAMFRALFVTHRRPQAPPPHPAGCHPGHVRALAAAGFMCAHQSCTRAGKAKLTRAGSNQAAAAVVRHARLASHRAVCRSALTRRSPAQTKRCVCHPLMQALRRHCKSRTACTSA